MIDRRRLGLGAGSLAVASLAACARPAAKPLFFGTTLAANPLAQRFMTTDVRAPPVWLDTDRGRRRLGDLRGPIRLVSLWAEWCVPCLFEVADLAALHRRFQASGFEVLAVLTGSGKKLDLSGARRVLHDHGADLPVWVEPNGGDVLLKRLAAQQLPCNLLVDGLGRIRGRAVGAIMAKGVEVEVRNGHPVAAVARPSAPLTDWGTPAAQAFVEGLLGDALEHRR